jgi:hypothetical protein
VQFYVSKSTAFSSAAKLLREFDLGQGSTSDLHRFKVRATVQLPESARSGSYYVIACTARRRGAEPSARNCLTARQRLLIKRSG